MTTTADTRPVERFLADNGIVFAVRVIREGDRYGRDDVLVNKVGERLSNGQPLVEFFDTRHDEVPDLGQFTGARYRVDTILGLDGWGSAKGGINLVASEPDWTIDAHTMQHVRDWLREVAVREWTGAKA